MAIQLAEAARIAEAEATTQLMDSGFLDIYTGSPPDPDAAVSGTKLAGLTFNVSAFGPVTDDGTNADSIANAIVSVLGLANGVAGYFRCSKSDSTSMFQGVITGSGGGGDMELGNTSIALNQVVNVTSFTYRKFEL